MSEEVKQKSHYAAAFKTDNSTCDPQFSCESPTVEKKMWEKQ